VLHGATLGLRELGDSPRAPRWEVLLLCAVSANGHRRRSVGPLAGKASGDASHPDRPALVPDRRPCRVGTTAKFIHRLIGGQEWLWHRHN